MLVAECINAVTKIALMHAISLSSRAVCLSEVSRHRLPPPSSSSSSALAFRICIRYYPVSFSSLELLIRHTHRSQRSITRSGCGVMPNAPRALLLHGRKPDGGAIRDHDSAVLESPVWAFWAFLSGI